MTPPTSRSSPAMASCISGLRFGDTRAHALLQPLLIHRLLLNDVAEQQRVL